MTPREFTHLIARMEKGCAPSAGYMMELIDKARNAMKNPTKIESKVQEMREQQRLFFKNRTVERMKSSKQLERQVDGMLNQFNRAEKQQELFR